MPSTATLPETVTLPVEAILDAAGHMQAVDEVADVLNDYCTAFSTPLGFAANRLIRAAFLPDPGANVDVDQAVMNAFLARANLVAAGWLEALSEARIEIGGKTIRLGKMLDIDSYDVERAREWAESYAKAERHEAGDA
jgi:hypothetical protein